MTLINPDDGVAERGFDRWRLTEGGLVKVLQDALSQTRAVTAPTSAQQSAGPLAGELLAVPG